MTGQHVAEETDDFKKYANEIETLILTLDNNTLQLKACGALSRACARVQTICDMKLYFSAAKSPLEPTTSSASSYKIKPLPVPTFSGELKDWSAFWDRFEQSVHRNKNFNDVEKLQYLMEGLKGPSKATLYGLSLTGSSYRAAIKLLTEKYGDPTQLVQVYYDELHSLETANDGPGQRSNLEAIRKVLNNLKSLQVPVDQDLLKSKILKKFSLRTIISVLTKIDTLPAAESNTSVETLLAALGATIKIQERAETIAYTKDDGDRPIKKKQPVAGILVAGSKPGQCVFCRYQHKPADCRKFASLNKRRNALSKQQLCHVCLKPNHKAPDCNKRNQPCALCDKKGHAAHLCVQHMKKLVAGTKKMSSTTKPKSGNFMETFVSYLKVGNSFVRVRGLIDPCSAYSFVKASLLRRLGINYSKSLYLEVCTFGTTDTHTVRSGEVRLTLTNMTRTFERTMNFRVTPHITSSDMVTSPSPDVVSAILPHKYSYADPEIFQDNKSSIDLLIGNSYQFVVYTGETKSIPFGLYLRKSYFGWIPTGEVIDPKGSMHPSPALLCQPSNSVLPISKPNSDYLLDQLLDRLWSLEALGIKSSELDETDDFVLERFRETVRFEDNRYVVRWPWKQDNPHIPSNFRMCMAQLRSSLQRNSHERLLAIHKLIIEQFNSGIIELAPKETPHLIHYLPHRAIMQKGKIRNVYNASAKTKSGRSLNDLLHRGPLLLQNLIGLLINFRLYPIALLADIEKAFLQIVLNLLDRDVVRFLWVKDINSLPEGDNLVVYRFTRVIFGAISSPFLLHMVLQELFSTPPCNKWHEFLKKHFYVDNLIASVPTVHNAIDLYNSSTQKMSSASFNLRDWHSNSEEFLRACNLPLLPEVTQPISALGLNWDPKADFLCVKLDAMEDFNPHKVTKRIALKFYASIYDPLGLLSPCSLKLKLFIQDCWKNQFNWDSLLPPHFIARWVKLYKECLNLPDIRIPRRYWEFIPTDDGNVILHIFCDSSKDAYACCAYLSFIDETSLLRHATLMFSKVRVAPTLTKQKDTTNSDEQKIKNVSVPRLELMAVVICKMSATFIKSMCYATITRIILWTDATTILQWLNSPTVQPIFVQNRLNEIRRCPNLTIRHVPTDCNPADIASRGSTPSNLGSNQLWWHGPTWLCRENCWPATPNTTEIFRTPALVAGSYKYSGVLSDELEKRFSLIDSHKHIIPVWDRYIHLFWCLNRYLQIKIYNHLGPNTDHNYAAQPQLSQLEEFEAAETLLIKELQRKYFMKEIAMLKKSLQPNVHLDLFLDKNGIVRCKGRLQYSPLKWDTIHPILLPRNSAITRALINDLHVKFHHIGVSHILSKLRERFWIMKGRTIVKSVLYKCVVCRRWEGGSFRLPPLPPLPTVRVDAVAPFEHTGVDYLGPVMVLENSYSTKMYIALFTCLVTRAIHLELARDMSADEFLQCLIRFTCRRGTPKFLISDNAPNFTFVSNLVGKKGEISDFRINHHLVSNRIHWKFIPQYAPWHGGAYERLVGVVKNSLKKSFGNRYMSYNVLYTGLCQIEDTVNSRPLTYVPDEVISILTPNHFIRPGTGVNANMRLEVSEKRSSTNKELLASYKALNGAISTFWDAFRSSYLTSLRERHTSIHKPTKGAVCFMPKLGDTVLIKEPHAPRADWKIGTIEWLDKRQAIAHLKSNGKLIIRSINLVCPLEVPMASPLTIDAKKPKTT